MNAASIALFMRRQNAKRGHHPKGFSLLEMMMVITVILIVASISAPIYTTAVVRAREAVLRDHPFTLRPLIDRLTLNNRALPRGLKCRWKKAIWGDSRLTTLRDQTKPRRWRRETLPSRPRTRRRGL